ncbi:MAG: hypothetical protein RRY40_04255 [Oscillospiraceae bacterium]
MRNKASFRIALGGICASLAVVIMLLNSVIPLATYLMPMIAGLVLLPCAIELDTKTAATCYAAVAVLSFMMVPDKEASMMFIAIFGYYPFLKPYLEKIKSRILKFLAKLLVFNGSVTLAYAILIFIFPITEVMEELGNGILIIAIYALGNISFFLYDWALNIFVWVYKIKIRQKLGFSRLNQLDIPDLKINMKKQNKSAK